MKRLDNGKLFQIIDNRNYRNEPAFLFETYYYMGANPFKAIASLVKNIIK